MRWGTIVSMSAYALLVEPDQQRAESYRHLVSAEGLPVKLARDGVKAEEIVAASGTPVLTITELSLTGADGFAVIRFIRARAKPDSAAVVAISAASALRGTAQKLQGELGLSGLLASWASIDTVAKAVRKAGRKALASVQESLLPELLPEEDGAPLELDEPRRLAAVEASGLHEEDPPPGELLKIVEQVALRFGVASSFISILTADRQWLRASTGLKGRLLADNGSARDASFCTHVVSGGKPLVVSDAAVHPFFSNNPLVRDGSLRSYAGAPLLTPKGAVLGSLCITDDKPMAIPPRYPGQQRLRGPVRARPR